MLLLIIWINYNKVNSRCFIEFELVSLITDILYFVNKPELQITGAITVQAWFKANNITDDYLFSKTGESGNSGWDISFNPIDTNFQGNQKRSSFLE